MKNILIVLGHTNLAEDSVANKAIMEELSKKLPQAEIDVLDKLYPDFKINVKAEQKKLEKADVIVLQFPIFWYAMPSIMSKWMEDTFVHGWSHGSTGDKLKGKKLIASFTTGAPAELYHKHAPMGHEIEEYLPPIQSTCGLCQMEFAGFVYTGGVSYQSRTDEAAVNAIKEKAAAHADKVVKLIDEL